jgi:hypothetical protein
LGISGLTLALTKVVISATFLKETSYGSAASANPFNAKIAFLHAIVIATTKNSRMKKRLFLLHKEIKEISFSKIL